MKIPQIGEIRKPAKTMAGVTPLTVVLKPRKCEHGTCIYCPGGEHVPQSYTDKSPAVMRALMLDFDPYRQVEVRLKAFEVMNHPTDKIELIILGGTFLQYPREYKYEFIKKCYDALNGIDSDSLEEAKKINETAKHRCVAMCIENRPDNCSEEEIKEMLEFGATRVEIGVQMPDDEMYKLTNRGHKVSDVVKATKELKNAGFKVGYHIMPGLPGSNPKKDMKLFKEIFKKDEFKPDQLKIYPCQIIKDSPLAKVYKKINYKPYSEEQTKKILEDMIKLIPEYCRVMRIMREIPPEKLVEGMKRIDIRRDVEKDLREEKAKIKEIRMREIGFNQSIQENIDLDTKLRITKYSAGEGEEYFLQVINKDNILFGLLRLRIFSDEKTNEKRAFIREIHVYGKSLPIKKGNKGEKNSKDNVADIQHKGIGKELLKEAENISIKNKIKNLKIISGVGVREYYKNLGYNLDEEGIYMEKALF